MRYFKFKVKDENKEVVEIKDTDEEYIKYDNFLYHQYCTSIKENEDYIPYKIDNEVIMILAENLFDMGNLVDVYEIMFDKLNKN